jgi:hypothetical protein
LLTLNLEKVIDHVDSWDEPLFAMSFLEAISNLKNNEDRVVADWARKLKNKSFTWLKSNSYKLFWSKRMAKYEQIFYSIDLNRSNFQEGKKIINSGEKRTVEVITADTDKQEGRPKRNKNSSPHYDETSSNSQGNSETIESNDEYYDSSVVIYYKLTQDEVGFKMDMKKKRLRPTCRGFPARLKLSNIVYSSTPTLEFSRCLFVDCNGIGDIISNFNRCISDNCDTFTVDYSKINSKYQPIVDALSYSFNIIYTKKLVMQTPQKSMPIVSTNKKRKQKKQEADFIIKYVNNFFQNLFFMHRTKLFYRWDSTSDIYDNSITKKRPDFIITTIAGLEVACGEVKPPGTSEELLDIDRSRVQEHCKRQLHGRMYHAQSTKEFIVYGFMVAGPIVELYVTRFIENKYKTEKVKTITLPTMPDTHTNMRDSLEIMIGFFENLVGSLSSENDDDVVEGLYDSVKKHLKPTLLIL